VGCQVWRQGDERHFLQGNQALHGVSWGGQDDHMCSAVAGQDHLVFDLTYALYLEDAYITIRLAPRNAENVMDIVNFHVTS
jgi:hypothetical protein